MPGVTVRTATRSGPVNQTVPTSGRYFVAGLLDRGRTDAPIRVRSMAEVEVELGGRVTYGAVYDDLRTYFEEGGSEAYVARVVGPAATLSTRTLVDKAGSPLPTLRIDAVSAGAWTTGNLTVESAAGTTAGTYKLTIRAYGETEVYDNLVTPADGAAALGTSRYVRGVDLVSATAAPNNQPAVLAASAMTTPGTDDRASVTGATIVTALTRFGTDLGAGAVAIPGYPSSVVGAGLIAHAKAYRRVALLSAAAGANDAAYIAAAAALTADGEYALLAGPWIRIPVANGITKLVTPEGYVAAMRARAHLDEGPWRAGAGELAIARFVVGLEREILRPAGDLLDEGKVSAIRTIAGTVRLYGYRSLSTDTANYATLTGRDVLNTIAYEAERRLEQYPFRTINGRRTVLGEVAGTLIGILEPMRRAGGLFEQIIDGEQIDPGYSVDVGDTINTLAVLQAGTVAAVIAARVSPVGSLIDLTIVKAGLTASV